MEDGEDVESMIQTLFKDLDLGEDHTAAHKRDLRQEFGDFLKAPVDVLRRIGLHAAVLIGSSGDWDLAAEVCRQMITRANDDRNAVRLWQLKCLVEASKFPEALALSTSTRWPQEQLIHVNYLTGEAFEGLKIFGEARLRFDAVFKLNRSYRSVAQKLTRY